MKNFVQVMAGVALGVGASAFVTVGLEAGIVRGFAAACCWVTVLAIWTGACCLAQTLGEVLR